MISDVEKIFDEHLKAKLGQKPEVLQFLLRHERKKLCLENLCGEIRVCEFKLGNSFFNAELYRKTIQDVARLFAETALEFAEQGHLTHLEKARRIEEASQYEALSKEITEGQERIEELPL